MNKSQKVNDVPALTDGKSDIRSDMLALSKKFKAAKFITLGVLALFIVGMLISNSTELSVENIRYLLRYLDADANVYSYTTEYKTISYNADSEMTFDIYRGDFVVADSQSVNIYASSGSNVLSTTSYISNPVILTTSGYMMVYDLGGNSYSIYNTFSSIHNESLDYPITGAAYSDSGAYALITKTAEYRSAVFVYDRNYNLTSRILKDKNKLIMGVDFNADGSELLVACASVTNDGDFNAEIMLTELNSDTPKKTFELYDIFPIQAKYNSHGFYLLCDRALYFYSAEGDYLGRYSYGSVSPESCVMTDDYAFLIFSDSVFGYGHTICVFDTDGTLIERKTFDGQYVNLLCNNSDIYILTADRLIRAEIGTSRTSERTITGNSIDLQLARNDTIYLCYAGYAEAVNITEVLPYDESAAFDLTALNIPAESEPAETEPFVMPETEAESETGHSDETSAEEPAL